MTLAVSLMLAVPSVQTAADWYERALGATRLRDPGSVVGLEMDGAPFFLHEVTTGFDSPQTLGATTVRVEDHEVSWGTHRQGGFTDPFGHRWLVGDKSPLERLPA